MTLQEEAQKAFTDACYKQGIDALYFAINDEIREQAISRGIEGTEYLALMKMCIDKAYLKQVQAGR